MASNSVQPGSTAETKVSVAEATSETIITDRRPIRSDIEVDLFLNGLFGMLNWCHRWFKPGAPYRAERVADTLGERFTPSGTRSLELRMRLTHKEVATLVAMGPSAWHTDRGVMRRKITELPKTCNVAASFRVSTFQPHPQSSRVLDSHLRDTCY